MVEVLDTKAILIDSSLMLKLDINGMKTSLERITKRYFKPATIQKRYANAFKLYQLGIIKDDTEFFKRISKGLSDRARRLLIEKHYKERVKHVKLNINVKEVISNLSRQYKLGLVSGMIKDWFKADASRLGLDHNKYFKNEVFTKDYGLLKSNKKLFFIACKGIEEPPKNCAYITNHANEARVSSSIGMQTVLLGSGSAGDIKINNIKELIDLFYQPFYEPGPTPMSKKR